MRTKKTVIILISGVAGAGKSTVQQILKNELETKHPDLSVAEYSLANPIKYISKAFMTWDGEKDDKGRKLLQDIGKVGRGYNQDIWVKHLLTQMDRNFGNGKQLYPTNFVIVDDWRFPNEVDYLKGNPMLDVVTIRLFGRGGLTGDVANDLSETSLPEITDEAIPTGLTGDHWYDFQIDNGADVDTLKSKLMKVLLEIEKLYIVE